MLDRVGTKFVAYIVNICNSPQWSLNTRRRDQATKGGHDESTIIILRFGKGRKIPDKHRGDVVMSQSLRQDFSR